MALSGGFGEVQEVEHKKSPGGDAEEVGHDLLPQPLVTSILLPISINLTILDNSFKWNHIYFLSFVSGVFHLT